jgi:hypothetical protein
MCLRGSLGVLSADGGTRFLWGPFLGPQIGRWLGTHSTPGTIVRQSDVSTIFDIKSYPRDISNTTSFLVQQ